jgi:hypothetical protein
MWGAKAHLLRATAVAAVLLGAGAAHAQAADGARIERLALRLERTESVRAVKRVQIAYAQYSEFGLWGEMANLFARDGVLQYGDATVRGRPAIARWFKTHFGGGRDGVQAGALHTQMSLTPVINLSADGRTAKGRWHEVSLLGGGGGDARWEGGIQENEYILEGGVWKIARLHHYAMYAGPYETGWRNLEADLKVVPFHYTPDEAGVPILPVPAGERLSAPSLGAIQQRLARMRDEDLVRNLQNAYGYYVDRKMWTDVTDLFTADGTYEIAGIGIWQGEQGIRRVLQRDGPPGLRYGEVNDHLQLDTLITVAPDGQEAWARGLDFGMLGRNKAWAQWTEAVFENHYVKQAGVWRLAAVRLFPKLRSDYGDGWGKSRLPEPVPLPGYTPDRPSAFPAPDPRSTAIPAFDFPNPATARAVVYPSGATVLGSDPAALHAAMASAPGGDGSEDIAALERGLAIEEAYDATENVSSAFGDYLDDFDWDDSSALFARTGRRNKYQVGFYVGPDRIKQAEITEYGRPKPPRISVQIHLRTQPVIDVAPDGRSTRLRTRLFSFNSMRDKAGDFQSGMYPNDEMVLQDGVWKFQHQAIDELYFMSAGYKGGWAGVADPNPNQFAPDRKPTIMDKLRTSFPPDVLANDMGVRERGFAPGPEFIEFPGIKPMWFHYVNPVSGRVPPNYCPDESTCYQTKPLFP